MNLLEPLKAVKALSRYKAPRVPGELQPTCGGMQNMPPQRNSEI